MSASPLSLLKDPSLFKTDALVNGQWVKGSSRFDVNNPATGEKLADVANLGAADAKAAIAAANAAWGPWRNKTGKERSIILRKWFDLLTANTDDLARILTAEQGKPFAEAKAAIRALADSSDEAGKRCLAPLADFLDKVSRGIVR